VSLRFHRTRTLIPLHEDDSNKSSNALFDLGQSCIYVSGGVDLKQTALELVVSAISVAIDKPRLSLVLDTLDHLRCIRWIDADKDGSANSESVPSALPTQSSSPGPRSNHHHGASNLLHKFRLGIGCVSIRLGSQLDVDGEPTATLCVNQLSAAAILLALKQGSAHICFEKLEVKVLERPLLACIIADDEIQRGPSNGLPNVLQQPERCAFVATGQYISVGPTPSLTVDLRLKHVSIYTSPSILEAVTTLSSEINSAREGSRQVEQTQQITNTNLPRKSLRPTPKTPTARTDGWMDAHTRPHTTHWRISAPAHAHTDLRRHHALVSTRTVYTNTLSAEAHRPRTLEADRLTDSIPMLSTRSSNLHE
jgi:hypothetical protein